MSASSDCVAGLYLKNPVRRLSALPHEVKEVLNSMMMRYFRIELVAERVEVAPRVDEHDIDS